MTRMCPTGLDGGHMTPEHLKDIERCLNDRGVDRDVLVQCLQECVVEIKRLQVEEEAILIAKADAIVFGDGWVQYRHKRGDEYVAAAVNPKSVTVKRPVYG
jgi:hypothetical protein